jgi:hypothetical protein
MALTSCATRPDFPLPHPCHVPPVDTVGWRWIGESEFSFMIPPGFQEVRVRPIDTYLREWRNGRNAISFDYGWNSWDLRPLGTEVGYSACSAQIGGKEARVVTFGDPSLGYVAAAHWTVREGQPAERLEDLRPAMLLTIFISTPNLANLEWVRAVVWTTRFPEQDS